MKVAKKSAIRQFSRFCAVGSLNAVIDFAVLNILLWRYPTGDIWRVLGYNSFAVLLAATNSFFWNKYWTFNQRFPITGQEVFRFAVLSSSTILMNDLLMELLSGLFPGLMNSSLIGSNALKLGAIIGTMSVSFFGMKLWVFFQRNHMRSPTVQVSPIQSLSMNTLSEMPTLKIQAQLAMKVPVITSAYSEQIDTSLSLQSNFTHVSRIHKYDCDGNVPDRAGRMAGKLRKYDMRIDGLYPVFSLPTIAPEEINSPTRPRIRPVVQH